MDEKLRQTKASPRREPPHRSHHRIRVWPIGAHRSGLINRSPEPTATFPNVIIRPVRRPFTPPARFVYGPVVTWRPGPVGRRNIISRPAANRLVWEDSETNQRREQWVESNLGVDARGKALFLDLQGSARIDFAEVRFENGQTQVIDFNEARLSPGLHPLLDFADGRRVDSVRIVARATTPQATLRLMLQQ